MKRVLFAVCLLTCGCALAGSGRASRSAVVVSDRNPRYFETADGACWIPIGVNICFDRLYDGTNHTHEAVRANFARRSSRVRPGADSSGTGITST